LGVRGSSRFPDSLGLDQADRHVSLIEVGRVEEEDCFTVAFLMQNETGSHRSTFPGAKRGVQRHAVCSRFEHNSKQADAVLVQMSQLAANDCIVAFVAIHPKAVLLSESRQCGGRSHQTHSHAQVHVPRGGPCGDASIGFEESKGTRNE
jgi:hypothetical protein